MLLLRWLQDRQKDQAPDETAPEADRGPHSEAQPAHIASEYRPEDSPLFSTLSVHSGLLSAAAQEMGANILNN